MKEMVCIICPRGCHLVVDDKLNVTGNNCPRGAKYAVSELTNPVRTITSFVKTNSLINPTCSVKTSNPIPKDKMLDIIKEINKIKLNVPVNIGDVVIKNVLGLDVDIVATSRIEK